MRRNLLSITIGFVGLAALAVPAQAQVGLPIWIDVTRGDLPSPDGFDRIVSA